MYRPRNLSGPELRAFHRALRGASDDPSGDPDAVVDEPVDESEDGPKVGESPTPPVADPGANPMRLVTANIRHGMSAAAKREDITKVRDMGSVIMWQELGNSESQSLVAQHLPESEWHHLPAAKRPTDRLSIRKAHWKVEQATSYLMHPKYPGVRGQRETYTTVALVTSKTSNVQFLVMAAHFTPHAWCGHSVPGKQWRKDKWNLHFNKMQSIAADARSKGITVIGGGDWNRPPAGVDKFHASQDWFRQSPLDYLFGIPAAGGSTYTLQSSQSVAMNSDHNALVAQLSWTAGTNPLKSGYHWPGL
jgi:hypothetical protein